MGKLEDEHLVQHAMSVLEDADVPSPDVFIFGHRHHPVHAPLPQGDAAYLNLGDWLTHMTSAVIHDGKAELIDHKKGHPSLTVPNKKGLPMGSPFSCCRVQAQRRTTNLAARL